MQWAKQHASDSTLTNSFSAEGESKWKNKFWARKNQIEDSTHSTSNNRFFQPLLKGFTSFEWVHFEYCQIKRKQEVSYYNK